MEPDGSVLFNFNKGNCIFTINSGKISYTFCYLHRKPGTFYVLISAV